MKTNAILSISTILCLLASFACQNGKVAGAFKSGSDAEFEDNMIHIFGYSCDDSGYEFISISCMTEPYAYEDGLHSMKTIRGTVTDEHYLIKGRYEASGELHGCHYSVNHIQDGRQVIDGEIVIHHMGQPNVLVAYYPLAGQPVYYSCIAVDRDHMLMRYDDVTYADASELVQALRVVPNCSFDWPVDAVTLASYLFYNSNSWDGSFDNLSEWNVCETEDRNFRLFHSTYYTGGSGDCAFDDIMMAQYRQGGTGNLITEFYEWVFGNGDEEWCNLGNFNHLESQNCWSMRIGDENYYFIEYIFEDSKPAYYDQNVYVDHYSILGAFEIKDGTLKPAHIINTPDGLRNRIVIACSGGTPTFKIDTGKRRISIPSVSETDLKFTGEYDDYEWSVCKKCFDKKKI